MDLNELLVNELSNNGITNIFDKINLIIDNKFLNERCYKIINEKKFISFWLMQSNGYDERCFSFCHNLKEEELFIRGYFGVNHVNNSLNLFKEEIGGFLHLLKVISKENENMKRISIIKCSDIKDKYFANILCHYVEIKINFLNINER